MNIVVSQPMFLPWIGLFEQIKLADVFVHYDDVQFPQGRTFISRVQVKTARGASWLTAPIDRQRSGRVINETWYLKKDQWRAKHLQTLRHCYSKSVYFDLMYDLIQKIYSYRSDNLADFNIHAIEMISGWLNFKTKFIKSSDLGIEGGGTQRLVDICKKWNGDNYITGLGALNYLDYREFEKNNIGVRYMDYLKKEYNQLYGDFTPYVTILDSVANCGEKTKELIGSKSIYWKDFLDKNG